MHKDKDESHQCLHNAIASLLTAYTTVCRQPHSSYTL